MELVAFLGKDKENWGQITGLINHGEWEKIILIKTKDSSSYASSKKHITIAIDSLKPLLELKKELKEELKDKFSGFDAHVSIASGSGKEHMALISALLSIPIGIRLVVFTKEGIEFIA